MGSRRPSKAGDTPSAATIKGGFKSSSALYAGPTLAPSGLLARAETLNLFLVEPSERVVSGNDRGSRSEVILTA